MRCAPLRGHRRAGGHLRLPLPRVPEAVRLGLRRLGLGARAGSFSLTRGTPATWSRPTHTGRTLHCMFCRACGSRVWHASPGSDTLTVKGGSLDGAVDLAPAVHIWTSRKLSGVVIPQGAAQYPGEPA